MAEAEVSEFSRSVIVHGHAFPPFGYEICSRMARGGNSPVILVAIGVPDVEKDMRTLGDHDSVALGRRYPAILRRPARQKIEAGVSRRVSFNTQQRYLASSK